MIGAIIGDIVGSRFEGWIHPNCKSKEFELFHKDCRPTDDSIMTLTVAKALLNYDGDIEMLKGFATATMREYGLKYPNAGYGGMFRRWINSYNPTPYNSYGNGSAMRTSPCAYVSKSLEEAVEVSRAVAEITHNHPEGINGAEATTVAIYMALNGKTMVEIREYIIKNYYNIDFTLDAIRPDYEFDVTCQGSVPQALEAFFESTGFEDAIRNAISIGGDSDTIAAITGGIAEAYYGVPKELREQVLNYLDDGLREIVFAFENKYEQMK